jgi:hypothetical protein
MTRIDPRPSENDQETEGAPLTRFTIGNGTRGRNAEPTALEKLTETERLCAAARQALRILEPAGLAPITAALLRAARKAAGGPIVADSPNRRLRHGVPVREDARCPT